MMSVQTFDTNIANKVGVAAAVVFDVLCRLAEDSRIREKNFHQGRYWVADGMKELKVCLPYLTDRQIKYALKKLVDGGYIVGGNFNESAFDRSMWYAVAG